MTPHSEVLADMAALRAQLRADGSRHLKLLRLNPLRPLADALIDWALLLASASAVCHWGLFCVPVALLLIANRQRALGNILHDAGHRNLCRSRRWNDLIAGALVAPALFADLGAYRDAHYRHHLALGQRAADPDLMAVPAEWPRRWTRIYVATLLDVAAWKSAIAGHLISPGAGFGSRLYIVAWWALLLAVLARWAGLEFAATFMGLWLAAKATAFHAITTFREMCDHLGLRPGGVFSFTRDMVGHGFCQMLIHPRNNGYHLTHHLLPAVPYYRLPEAQRLFSEMPAYRARGTVCRSYFAGPMAVSRAWEGVAA